MMQLAAVGKTEKVGGEVDRVWINDNAGRTICTSCVKSAPQICTKAVKA